MSITAISGLTQYKNKGVINNISFKKRESREDATNFASAYFNTTFSVDPKTKIKKLAQRNNEGQIIKEIYIDNSDKIIKMLERNQNENVKEIIFENDGKTIKEIKEYATDNETILLRKTTYNADDEPFEQIFNREGILTKEIETKKDIDGIKYTLITIYDEKSRKPIEKTENGKDKSTTQFFYDEQNRLKKTIKANKNTRTTNIYNPENEKITRTDVHYILNGQNPLAANKGDDIYTIFEYDNNGKLLKEKTFKTMNDDLIKGTKYDPITGKKIFYLDRSLHNHYAENYKNNELVSARFYPTYNVVKTYYYDKGTPYREVTLNKNKYCIDTIYKKDNDKYNRNKKIEDQEIVSKKYTKLDDFHFNKIIRLFNKKDVIDIEKDYSNPKYDIFKIKLPKNTTIDDFK